MKLVKVHFNSSDELALESRVDIDTKIRHQIDRQHPTDAFKRIRFGKFYDVSIDLQVAVNDAEFTALSNFIATADEADVTAGTGLYFVDDGSEYPITSIESMPSSGVANPRFLSAVSLKSVFVGFPPRLPNHINYGAGNYGDGGYGW